MHFFWPNLRCKVIEQMVKSRYLVEFPAQKKEPKWFQNLGRFKKPCLSLNMVRRNRFIKWQTPARNAKSSFEGANPTPPSPMQRRRPPARTTIESKRTRMANKKAPSQNCKRNISRLEGAIPKLQAKHLELRWHPKTVSSGCN